MTPKSGFDRLLQSQIDDRLAVLRSIELAILMLRMSSVVQLKNMGWPVETGLW